MIAGRRRGLGSWFGGVLDVSLGVNGVARGAEGLVGVVGCRMRKARTIYRAGLKAASVRRDPAAAARGL